MYLDFRKYYVVTESTHFHTMFWRKHLVLLHIEYLLKMLMSASSPNKVHTPKSAQFYSAFLPNSN
jgi:hypothetical protein